MRKCRLLSIARGWYATVAVSLAGMAVAGAAFAAAPTLYATPFFGTPVHGDPGDLLMIPGSGLAQGDLVAYEAVGRRSRGRIAPPDSLPSIADAKRGIAPVASANAAPFALTIRLPRAMAAGEAYRLWVRDAAGEWSNAIEINDARPLWFSPDVVYASADPALLGRVLKVVGRNLAPAPGHRVRVVLTGPERITLSGTASGASTDLAYVTTVRLPRRLKPGRYAVRLSRDGRDFIPVKGPLLTVLPDPMARPRFDVGAAALGGCRPGAGHDATPCILRAIHAAAAAGGGSVVFGPGTWNLIDAHAAGVIADDGIVLPPGVDLIGAGRTRSLIRRAPRWNSGGRNFTFTLTGKNAVIGLGFVDDPNPDPAAARRPCLQLRADAPSPVGGARRGGRTIHDILIRDDAFEGVDEAIADSGEPMARLFITHNVFAAYRVDLEMPGNRFETRIPFRIDDSVITANTFYPSAYLDFHGRTGVLASELGAAHRVDFSHNVADGASRRYIADPAANGGWRAAFFWDLNGNNEDLLVADNDASCTGDKIGDGEAFAFDNNATTLAFNGTRAALTADRDSISVAGPLLDSQNGRPVDVARYYVGHWIDVVDGPGLGQVRKIVGLRLERHGKDATFTVAPAWDIVPSIGNSRVTIARQFWQIYVIGNRVDNRRPPCAKSNLGRPKAGVISLWAQAADSVIAGNRQYDSDGILLQQSFKARGKGCADCETETMIQDFNEIRDNLIDGEYRWDSACSLSGIELSYAASPTPEFPPPILSFDVLIAHNTIDHADGGLGGAIDVLPTWFVGPPPYRRPLIDNLLIFDNTLRRIDGPPPQDECGYHQPQRIGIKLAGRDQVWNTVLGANRCENVGRRLVDEGVGTTRICGPAGSADSCECQRPTDEAPLR